jgi:hypothetical protein
MIEKAIANLAPTASWYLSDNAGYEGIEWYSNDVPKPTKLEVETEIARLQAEYNSKVYARSRAAEYPPITDYIDGVVKGDQAQIDKYIADCLAVKQKYPKPE